MPTRLNPIDHPVCLEMPERRAVSSWVEHVPFAMWLTSALHPRVLVELGTHHGTSYSGFCQAIKTLDLPARAFAVDSWKGDPHSGSGGPEVLANLRQHHDPRYGSFSTLLEMSFDEAALRFADNEIDLLHIDGYHTYEAVRHDFETWQPKLTDRAIVLFHDIAERVADFGVYRLWDELTARFPSFSFVHEHGLGMLAIGRDLPDDIRTLASLRGEEAERIRALFRELGRRVRLEMDLDSARAPQESLDRLLRNALASLPEPHGRLATDLERACGLLAKSRDVHAGAAREANDRLVRMERERDRLAARIRVYDLEMETLNRSLSWQLVQRLSKLAGSIGPKGSRRRQVLNQGARLVRHLTREGPIVVGRRKVLEAALHLRERTRIWRGARDPWRPDGRPVFLLISHDRGGGTERHVRDLDGALKRESIRPLLVQPSGAGRVLWTEYDERGQRAWCRESTAERGSIEELLLLLRPVHAHVHHLMGLPEVLMDLLAEHGVTCDWTVHDYYTICPRVNLIAAGGKYCGEPDAASCNRCLASLGDDQERPVSDTITSWRERFGRRLREARRVFVPSEDVRRRLARYFPDLSVLVRPHPEVLPELESLAVPPGTGETVRVAVLGTIVPVKGADRLQACAHDARRRRLPLEFHVIGSTDRDAKFARLGNVQVTGRYREPEVYERLAAQRCHLAFLPSSCPESFMFTLSIAMAARMFVVCFDHGAQAERLRAWGWGQLLDPDTPAESINDSLLAAARSLADGPASPLPPQAAVYREFLTDYYDFTSDDLGRLRDATLRNSQTSGHNPHFEHRRDHAHLH